VHTPSLLSLSLSSSPPYTLKTAKRKYDGGEFDELDKVEDVSVVAPQPGSELSDQLFFNKRAQVITKTLALKVEQEKVESPKH
jgi:hypothetical protein